MTYPRSVNRGLVRRSRWLWDIRCKSRLQMSKCRFLVDIRSNSRSDVLDAGAPRSHILNLKRINTFLITKSYTTNTFSTGATRRPKAAPDRFPRETCTSLFLAETFYQNRGCKCEQIILDQTIDRNRGCKCENIDFSRDIRYKSRFQVWKHRF